MMHLKQIMLSLCALTPFMHGAAGDAAAQIALLDCFERKTIAAPGAHTNRTWVAHHKTVKIADLSHEDRNALLETESITIDATKMLHCCVGYVEGKDEGLAEKAIKAIAQDLNPQNDIWAHPFDFRGALDLKQFMPDIDMTSEQAKDMEARLKWFRCTDVATCPYQNIAEKEICSLEQFILPHSFKKAMLEMVMACAEDKIDQGKQLLELMLQKKAMSPEFIALVDTYVRSQGAFHEASYLALNAEKFAAFAAQEFSE